MLNEKYGTYWIPLEIAEQDFQMILKKVTENEKQFVNQWYKLSETFEPRSYVLQVGFSRSQLCFISTFD